MGHRRHDVLHGSGVDGSPQWLRGLCPAHERRGGWHRGTISLAAAIGALVSGLSQPFVGQLYDRLGGRQLILVPLVVSGVWTMLLALTTPILVLIMLFGGVLSIAMGGSSLTGHQLGGALSIQLGGTLGDLTGSYDLPFALAGLLLLGASLAGVMMRERRYSTRYQSAVSAVGN